MVVQSAAGTPNPTKYWFAGGEDSSIALGGKVGPTGDWASEKP